MSSICLYRESLLFLHIDTSDASHTLLHSFAIAISIYEFYFQSEPVRKGNMLKRQFDSGVKIMERLIAMGVEQGEFSCEDCRGMARHIMFVLEGLEMAGTPPRRPWHLREP